MRMEKDYIKAQKRAGLSNAKNLHIMQRRCAASGRGYNAGIMEEAEETIAVSSAQESISRENRG